MVRYHTIQKQIHAAKHNPKLSEEERERVVGELENELQECGGLDRYQVCVGVCGRVGVCVCTSVCGWVWGGGG